MKLVTISKKPMKVEKFRAAFPTVETDGNVYLVYGEDNDVYGVYTLRNIALDRKNKLVSAHGDHFRIEIFPLGDSEV